MHGKVKMMLSLLDRPFDPYGMIDALFSGMYSLKDHTAMLHQSWGPSRTETSLFATQADRPQARLNVVRFIGAPAFEVLPCKHLFLRKAVVVRPDIVQIQAIWIGARLQMIQSRLV